MHPAVSCSGGILSKKVMNAVDEQLHLYNEGATKKLKTMTGKM
ncbi:hypothetical protein BCP12_99 [Bacillus phage BCP12]|uniref:Uncharacterized protein n=1 Tax=Bacillus phage BCP12 TaxID=1913122 RepID=A0A2S0CSP5_9CAUD|nr:hypothetical protein BCP12_99 [Bacillus phage BCP12]